MDTLPRVAYACALFNHISLGMKTWYVRLTNRFVAGLDNPISRRICSVGMLLGNRRISRDGLLLVSSRISSYDIVHLIKIHVLHLLPWMSQYWHHLARSYSQLARQQLCLKIHKWIVGKTIPIMLTPNRMGHWRKCNQLECWNYVVTFIHISIEGYSWWLHFIRLLVWTILLPHSQCVQSVRTLNFDVVTHIGVLYYKRQLSTSWILPNLICMCLLSSALLHWDAK